MLLKTRQLGKTANGPVGAKEGGHGGGEERPTDSIQFPFRGMKPGKRAERGRGAEETSGKEGRGRRKGQGRGWQGRQVRRGPGWDPQGYYQA